MSDRKSLLEIIKVIPDYRNARGRIYTIESIRFCIICGFMCGCYNAVNISDYIDLNFDFSRNCWISDPYRRMILYRYA